MKKKLLLIFVFIASVAMAWADDPVNVAQGADVKFDTATGVDQNPNYFLVALDDETEFYLDHYYFYKAIVPTTSITVTAPATEISVGKTATLTVKNQASNTVAADKVDFVSSDEAIATVDADGVVTAKAVGEVTITATLKDNSSIKNTIDLTVAPKPEGLEVTSNDGKHSIIVKTYKYTGSSDYYEMIVYSDDEIEDTHNSYWHLNSNASTLIASTISGNVIVCRCRLHHCQQVWCRERLRGYKG